MLPFTAGSRTIGNYQFTLPPMANPQASQIIFSEPFELQGNRNVEITATAPVANSWMSIDVDLINDKNNEVESVPLDVEYYSGVEGGESWSEGSNSNSAILSALPQGRYTLRVEGSWQNWQQPMPVTVLVTQNAFRGMNFCCAFVLLSIIPLLGLIWHLTFESRRWNESMFSSSGSSNSSDDD
jgi:hypothetical protein